MNKELQRRRRKRTKTRFSAATTTTTTEKTPQLATAGLVETKNGTADGSWSTETLAKSKHSEAAKRHEKRPQFVVIKGTRATIHLKYPLYAFKMLNFCSLCYLAFSI